MLNRYSCMLAGLTAILLSYPALGDSATEPADPYERYVVTSKDFQRVKQDPASCAAAFPTWTYMPWT